MAKTSDKAVKRKKRQFRLRSKLAGNAERPRLAIFRSLKHIYAQLIDDDSGRTLAATSTKRKEVAEKLAGKSGGNIDAAKIVGQLIAESAKAQGVTKVCFDRGGFRYHGRVKALADAAREAGLEF